MLEFGTAIPICILPYMNCASEIHLSLWEPTILKSFKSGFKSAIHNCAVRFDNVLLANAEMSDQLISHSATIITHWDFYST